MLFRDLGFLSCWGLFVGSCYPLRDRNGPYDACSVGGYLSKFFVWLDVCRMRRLQIVRRAVL